MRKVITFEFDGALVVALVLVGFAALFALHAAYPSLYKYWPDTSQDLAAWIQAVGSIAAIVGAFAVVNHQERKVRHRSKQLAIGKARSVLAQVQAQVEYFEAHGSLWLSHATGFRMLMEECLLDARSIEAELLNIEWRAQIYALRSCCAQLIACIDVWRTTPPDTRAEGLGQLMHHKNMMDEVRRLAVVLSSIEVVIEKKHPGVDAYAE